MADSKHPLIHAIQRLWNPILDNISYKNAHLTESYVFSKSTFRHNPLLPLLLKSSTTSLAIRTLSKIPLPFTKIDWHSCIKEDNTFFILLAKIFEIILYIAPTNEMSLYCSSLDGSLTLGTKAMKEALQPFRILPVSWNRDNAATKSSFSNSQFFLMKLKL